MANRALAVDLWFALRSLAEHRALPEPARPATPQRSHTATKVPALQGVARPIFHRYGAAMQKPLRGARSGSAIYAVLRHHGISVDQRSRWACILDRYTEHEIHGFFVYQRRKGFGIGACLTLLSADPAAIDKGQAMGGKPIPWGHTNEVMLARLQKLFVGLGLSTKLAARVHAPSARELDERRLDAKQALIRRMLA